MTNALEQAERIKRMVAIEQAMTANPEELSVKDLLAFFELLREELRGGGSRPNVRWIVSEGNEDGDNGEFGVEINGKPYFYYKHPDPTQATDTKYRVIHKREFGEVIRKDDE